MNKVLKMENRPFEVLKLVSFAEGVTLRNLSQSYRYQGNFFKSSKRTSAIELLEKASKIIGDFSDDIRHGHHSEEAQEVFLMKIRDHLLMMWRSDNIHVKASADAIECVHDTMDPLDEVGQLKREVARLKRKI